MRGSPIEQVGPEPFRIMPQRRIARHRSADGVDDARALDHGQAPAGLARAKAKVDVLAVEAKSFVEWAGRFPDFTSNSHGRAADPVNLAQTLLSVLPTSEEMSKPPRP